MEQEEPESEVANRECPLNRRGAGEGAAHNFWEIKMGSGLDLVSLAGGHYVIFLHVRLVFLLTKFSGTFCGFMAFNFLEVRVIQ